MNTDDILISEERASKSFSDDPEIFIDLEAELKIISHAHFDTSKELGGLLLGTLEAVSETFAAKSDQTSVSGSGKEPGFNPNSDLRQNSKVTVLAHIPAKFTDNSSASITFTHETWKHFESVHMKDFPDLKIIGWYHTHPSFGVFLSGKDTFIQDNFFNLPWQIAMVIDPINGTKGYFTWQGGKSKLSKKINYISHNKENSEATKAVSNHNLDAKMVKSENKNEILCVAIGFSSDIKGSKDLVLYEPYENEGIHTYLAGKTEVYIYIVSKEETISDICQRFYGTGKYTPATAGMNQVDINEILGFGRKIKLLPKDFFESDL